MGKNKTKILVIEDNPLVAVAIKRDLKNSNFENVKLAHSGEEGISYLSQEKMDLILMDVKLAGKIDGIVTADIIRNLFEIPVIFLTALSDQETLNRAKLTQPYGYILKPVQKNILKSNIEIALYKHFREKKIRNSGRWFAVGKNGIPAVVMFVDGNGVIIFINSQGSSILGRKEDQIIGKNFDSIFCLNEKKDKSIDFLKLFDGGIGYHILDDLCFRDINDNHIKILARVSTVWALDGDVAGSVVTFTPYENKSLFFDSCYY